MHLDEAFYASRKEHLLAKRDKVRKEVSRLEAQLPQISDNNRLIATRSLIRSKHETLVRIEAALNRLDDGSYGTCLVCGRPIPVIRLERMPEAPSCVRCSRKGGK